MAGTSKINRIIELDMLRGIAIIAVIGTHITTLVLQVYTEQRHIIDFGTQLSHFFNQFFRFSVPLFLLLSGLTLTLSQERRGLNLFRFYEKRFVKILAPYVLWTVFFTYYLSTSVATISLQTIYHNILYGDADYHLYFMVVILQCYLVFPLFYSLLKKCSTTWRQAIVILLILLQGLLYFFFELYKVRNYQIDEYHAFRFAGFWFIYFLLGIACGLSYETISAFIKRMWLPLILCFGLVTFGIVYWEANDYFKISHYAILNYFRPSVLVYALASFLVLYRLTGILVQTAGFGLVKSFLLKIGGYSFGIYFIHTLVIRKVMATGLIQPLPSSAAFVALFIGTTGISFALLFFYHKLLRSVSDSYVLIRRRIRQPKVFSPGKPPVI